MNRTCSFCFRVLLPALFVCATTALAQPRPGEDARPPAQRRGRQHFDDRIGWHFVNGRWLKPSGAARWDQIIQLGWRSDQFTITVAPTTQAAALLKGGRNAAIEIGPAGDLYNISRHEISPLLPPPELAGQLPPVPGELATYVMAHWMPENGQAEVDLTPNGAHPNDPLRILSLMAARDVLRVNARGMLRGVYTSLAFFGQMNSNVRLVVNIDHGDAAPETFVLQASSMASLIVEHPVDVRRYLSPLLRLLMNETAADPLGPGAADVYRAFPQIAANPAVAQRVREILPRMLDPDFDVRSRTLDALLASGAPGVCAVAQIDPHSLAPQQRAMVEQFLRDQSHRGALPGTIELSALRKDPLFLTDCLAFDDPSIRAVAAQTLGKLLNRPMKVDPLDAPACRRLADSLREAALRQVPAATQP